MGLRVVPAHVAQGTIDAELLALDLFRVPVYKHHVEVELADVYRVLIEGRLAIEVPGPELGGHKVLCGEAELRVRDGVSRKPGAADHCLADPVGDAGRRDGLERIHGILVRAAAPSLGLT